MPDSAVKALLARDLAQPLSALSLHEVSGGDIARSFRLQYGRSTCFVKVLPAANADLLQAEAENLNQLQSAGCIRVPRVCRTGADDQICYLMMEHLELHARSQSADRALGHRLAQLHRHTGSGYGFQRSNYIGLSVQLNDPADNWVDFYRECRLLPQLRQLQSHQADVVTIAEPLLQRLDAFFIGYRPEPSLLHGDLWSGNAAMTGVGHPVVYDPACYYGDRETDIAMTELFGGFSHAFYQAYQQAWPLDNGYPQRKPLYQLYHLLNHANLFGGSYIWRSVALLHRLGG